MLTDTAPPGWYPDPSGGTRLRWWDGADWSEHFRPRPLRMPDELADAAADAGRAAVGSGVGARDVDRIVSAVQSSTRNEMDRAVGELRQAARSEVDRVVGEVRRQAEEFTPLITDSVSRLTRYVRLAAVVGFLLVVAYFAFQVIAGIGIAELVGDIADRVIDAVNDDESAPAAIRSVLS